MNKYENFNNEEVDLSQYKDISLTEYEKEKIYRRFCQRINKDLGKRWAKKSTWVAAACFLLIIGATMVTAEAIVKQATDKSLLEIWKKEMSSKEEDLITKKDEVESALENYSIELKEHYLDSLGFGYFSFGVKNELGTRICGDNEVKVGFRTRGANWEFENCEITPITKEDDVTIVGYFVSFYSPFYLEEGKQLYIQFDKKEFLLERIEITNEKVDEWEIDGEMIKLTAAGLWCERNGTMEKVLEKHWFDNKDSEKSNEETLGHVTFAKVTYEDGRKDELYLSDLYLDKQKGCSVAKFSPNSKVTFSEEKTFEEKMEKWYYHYSNYVFDLGNYKMIKIGDIVLKKK